jgi:hypothetical protein
MEHKAVELKRRTKSFALWVIRPGASVTFESRRLNNRKSTATIRHLPGGANHRAVCRARSGPEFLGKLGVVMEEADESTFWLERLTETGLVPEEKLHNLKSEANQLFCCHIQCFPNHCKKKVGFIQQSRINNPERPHD